MPAIPGSQYPTELEIITNYNRNPHSRPYIVPLMTPPDIEYIRRLINLINTGINISWSAIHHSFHLALNQQEYRLAEKLIPLLRSAPIRERMSISLNIPHQLMILMKLAIPNMITYVSNNSTFQQVINTIENYDGEPIDIDNDNRLLINCMKLLRIRHNLNYGSGNEDEYNVVDIMIRIDDIDQLSNNDKNDVLITALIQGRTRLAKSIIESGYDYYFDQLNGLGSYVTFFRVLNMINERYVKVDLPSLFVQFIDADIDLDHCTNAEFNQYWYNIEIDDVSNPMALRWFDQVHPGVLSTCEQILADINGDYRLISQLDRYQGAMWYSNVNDNQIKRLISFMIGFIHEADLMIMEIIVQLHLLGKIDIRNYGDRHQSIEFLINRMSVRG